jgi:hypothetical protein
MTISFWMAGMGTQFSFFVYTTLISLLSVLAGECVAAECTGCQLTSNKLENGDIGLYLQPKHDPQYDRALVFRHICDNLLRLPVYWWPPQAVTMTARYLPILRARFGELIVPIEHRIVQSWKDAECLECGTYWDAYTGGTSPLPKPTADEAPTIPRNGSTPSNVNKNQTKAGGSNKKKSNNKKKRRK